MSRRLFVLVRSDLSRSQQAVQAAHAVGAFCSEEFRRWHWNGRDIVDVEPRWDNETLVLLKVDNLEELIEYFKMCEGTVAFFEPDIGMEMTAFATPIEHYCFSDLKLL